MHAVELCDEAIILTAQHFLCNDRSDASPTYKEVCGITQPLDPGIRFYKISVDCPPR
jgi:hypothetical protein